MAADVLGFGASVLVLLVTRVNPAGNLELGASRIRHHGRLFCYRARLAGLHGRVDELVPGQGQRVHHNADEERCQPPHRLSRLLHCLG